MFAMKNNNNWFTHYLCSKVMKMWGQLISHLVLVIYMGYMQGVA